VKHSFLARDAEVVPGLSETFIPMQTAAWHDARAQLEAPGTPVVLTVERDGTRRARAMMCRTWFGLREMPLMDEPSDFSWEDEVALNALARKLIAEHRPFYLERLPVGSATLDALRRAAKGKFWLRVEPAPPTPRIDIRFRSINELVNSGRRSDIRRAGKRLGRLGEVSFELRAPGSQEDCARLIDEAFDVETRSWKQEMGTALTSPSQAVYARAFRGYLARAYQAGHLRFAFLRLDGKAVAMQIASEWRNRYWIYKATFDKAHAKSSPGNLLYYRTLENSVERGLSSYEFMGKMDDWTRAWTQDTRDYVQVFGLPRNPRALLGAVFVARWSAEERVKARARELRRNRKKA